MRRTFWTVVLTLAVLAAPLSWFNTYPVAAHPVVVDTSAAEWYSFGKGPTEKQEGHIIRNAGGQGEYAWHDALNDFRLITNEASPSEMDLRQLRVTGSADMLYIYAQFARISNINGTKAVQLQLALRTNFTTTSTNTTFVAPATGSIASTNAWQYLIQTNFAAAQVPALNHVAYAQPLVYTSATGSSNATGQGRLSKDDNSIELAIPWSALGSAGGPLNRVRFATAVVRSSAQTPGDGIASSNIRDVVSPLNTQTELSDGKLDYAFDVFFDTTVGAAIGEVYSPLLITEVAPVIKASGDTQSDTKSQWLEVTNVTGSTLAAADLAQYKVGDTSNKDSTEGMFRLPNTDLAAGQAIIIARQRNSFKSRYPTATYPGINYGSSSGTSVGGNVFGLFNDGTKGGNVNLLTPYAPAGWLANTSTEVGGPFQLPMKPATGTYTYTDQIVLLDSQDTIADLFQYASPGVTKIYPDNTPFSVPASGLVANTDFQRCPTNRDSNNAPVDFAQTTVQAQHTPGVACAFIDLSIIKTGQTNVVVGAMAPTVQTYVITYGNNRLPAMGGTIIDTLPINMGYRADLSSSSPALGAPTITSSGSRAKLTWTTLPVLPTGATGYITVTTELPANTPIGTSSNDVQIAGPANQPEVELLNNSFSLPVAYVPEPTADIAVTKRVADSTQLYPDGYIVYAIDLSNTGTKDADTVQVLDTSPASLRYQSNSLGLEATAPASDQIAFNLGSVPQNTLRRTMLVTFTVAPDAVEGSVIQNQVALTTATTPELPTTNNSAVSDEATIGPKPDTADVSIVKHVYDASQLYPGGKVVYSIDYSNLGTLDADEATIVDTFPTGLTYSANSLDLPALVLNDNQVSFNLGSLPTQTLTTTMLVTFIVDSSNANVGRSIQNRAEISTIVPDAPITNNSALSEAATIVSAPNQPTPTQPTPTQQTADVAVTTRVQDASQAYPGGHISYAMSYENSGSQSAAAVQLIDTVPANLSYSANSANLAADQSVAGQVSFSLGTLAAQSSGTLIVTFTIPSSAKGGNTVQNQVVISTSSTESTTTNNRAVSEVTTLLTTPGRIQTTRWYAYLPIVRK